MINHQPMTLTPGLPCWRKRFRSLVHPHPTPKTSKHSSHDTSPSQTALKPTFWRCKPEERNPNRTEPNRTWPESEPISRCPLVFSSTTREKPDTEDFAHGVSIPEWRPRKMLMPPTVLEIPPERNSEERLDTQPIRCQKEKAIEFRISYFRFAICNFVMRMFECVSWYFRSSSVNYHDFRTVCAGKRYDRLRLKWRNRPCYLLCCCDLPTLLHLFVDSGWVLHLLVYATRYVAVDCFVLLCREFSWVPMRLESRAYNLTDALLHF